MTGRNDLQPTVAVNTISTLPPPHLLLLTGWQCFEATWCATGSYQRHFMPYISWNRFLQLSTTLGNRLSRTSYSSGTLRYTGTSRRKTEDKKKRKKTRTLDERFASSRPSSYYTGPATACCDSRFVMATQKTPVTMLSGFLGAGVIQRERRSCHFDRRHAFADPQIAVLAFQARPPC